MAFTVEIDREDDGRFIADIPALPGVLAYGATREEAIVNVRALAVQVIADRSAKATRRSVRSGAPGRRRRSRQD
jgi:predicted RNase H-like HicB family nuclease